MDSVGTLLSGQRLVVVGPSTSVLEAASLMTQRQVGAVPVVDADRLVGIFTERDIMTRVVAAGLDAAATDVSTVMTTALVVSDVGEPRDVALARLEGARLRHLLVLRDGRLAGIVSMRDFIRRELEDRDEALTLLNAYVHQVPPDLTPKKP